MMEGINFVDYGIVGACMAFMMYLIVHMQKKEDSRMAQLNQVINNNTVALTRVYEVIKNVR